MRETRKKAMPKMKATISIDKTTWLRFKARATEGGTNASHELELFMRDWLDKNRSQAVSSESEQTLPNQKS